MSDDKEPDFFPGFVGAVIVAVFIGILFVIVVHQRDHAEHQLRQPQTVQVPRPATANALKVCRHVEIDFGQGKKPEVIGRGCR